jgi:hypothetical protein
MSTSNILDTAKLVRACHAPAAASAIPAPDQVKSGRVTKTIARNRDRVAGTNTKTSSRSRGTLQPDRIVWANEAGWLKPMLGLAPSMKTKLMQSSGLLAAAKMVYIMKHDLTTDDIAALLTGCGISDKASAKYVLSRAQLKDNVFKFQGGVMDDLIYPRVAEIIGAWKEEAANAYKKFEDLVPASREAL